MHSEPASICCVPGPGQPLEQTPGPGGSSPWPWHPLAPPAREPHLQLLQLLHQGPAADEALVEQGEDGRTFQDGLPESSPRTWHRRGHRRLCCCFLRSLSPVPADSGSPALPTVLLLRSWQFCSLQRAQQSPGRHRRPRRSQGSHPECHLLPMPSTAQCSGHFRTHRRAQPLPLLPPSTETLRH